MKNVAIVFESKMGQTRAIAEHMKRRLIQHGHSVGFYEVTRGRQNRPIGNDVDTVILGAPVYAHRFPKPLVRWVRNHQDALQGKTTAFYSVSLNPADRRPQARQADDELLRQFVKASGLVPRYVASVAGALKYLEYGWLKRWLMKRIAASAGGPTDTSRDYELTDWSQVDLFVDTVIGRQEDSRFVTRERLKGAA